MHLVIDIVHNCHKQHQVNPENPALKQRKAALRRSLFTVGVLCKHFDFDSDDMGMKSQAVKSIEDFVFEQLMYFLWHEDDGIRQQALTAIGWLPSHVLALLLLCSTSLNNRYIKQTTPSGCPSHFSFL